MEPNSIRLPEEGCLIDIGNLDHLLLPEIQKSDENQLTQNIRDQFLSCKVEEECLSVRNKHPENSRNFTIIGTINGIQQEILRDDFLNYHKSLLNEVSKKISYNMSLNTPLSAEQFDFVRRIDPKEWKILAQKINSCQEPSEAQIEALQKKDFNNEVYQQEDWDLLALKSYFSGKIDRDTIATLLLYYSSHTNDSFKIHDKLDDDYKNKIIYYLEKIGMFPKDDKINDIMEKIRLLPREDTLLFSLDFLFSPKHETQNLVFFSPKMLNFINKELFGEDVMLINPVLGFSLTDDFTHLKKRDALIPYRFVTHPTYIHENDIQKIPLFAYIHDSIHLHLESLNPDRSMWLKLAAELEELPITRNQILDRIFSSYTEVCYLNGQNNDGKDKWKIIFADLKNQIIGLKEGYGILLEEDRKAANAEFPLAITTIHKFFQENNALIESFDDVFGDICRDISRDTFLEELRPLYMKNNIQGIKEELDRIEDDYLTLSVIGNFVLKPEDLKIVFGCIKGDIGKFQNHNTNDLFEKIANKLMNADLREECYQITCAIKDKYIRKNINKLLREKGFIEEAEKIENI